MKFALNIGNFIAYFGIPDLFIIILAFTVNKFVLKFEKQQTTYVKTLIKFCILKLEIPHMKYKFLIAFLPITTFIVIGNSRNIYSESY